MAHKGKRYKLQFRRDLTLNQFQTTGAAEAYNGRTIIIREVPPGVIVDQIVQYINLDKSASVDRTWVSKNFTFAGRNCRIRWTMEKAYEFGDVVFDVRLETVGGTLLLHKRSKSVSTVADWRFFSIDVTQPWDYQDPDLNGTWNNIEIDLSAAGYDTYNP